MTSCYSETTKAIAIATFYSLEEYPRAPRRPGEPSGGISITSFAKTVGIPVTTFWSWLKRERRLATAR